jgi:tRNA pseudouridine55 synthase
LKRDSIRLDGVVLLDKPSGITSNAALQRVRRSYRAAKAGHTGTLDPLATGLLPVCLGEATKFSALLLDADKTYLADIRFGVTTATGDAEGAVVARGAVSGLTPQAITEVLSGIQGALDQVPPMYSALKHQGRALYEYARAGETVERASRAVMIHAVEVVAVGADHARVRLRVSKGTYIRSVAEEAGRRLGCGAHLAALRREATGGLHLGQAVTLEALEAMPEPERMGRLLPVDLLVQALPRVEVTAEDAEALRQGRQVPAPAGTPDGVLRLYGSGCGFLGVGTLTSQAWIAPRRQLRQAAGAAP